MDPVIINCKKSLYSSSSSSSTYASIFYNKCKTESESECKCFDCQELKELNELELELAKIRNELRNVKQELYAYKNQKKQKMKNKHIHIPNSL